MSSCAEGCGLRALAMAGLAWLALAGGALAADAARPKLGPDAVPLTADHAYLAAAPAPDYWAFAPFVKPQFTSSACSVAAVTAAVNGLRGLPALADQPILTQAAMLELVGDSEWSRLSAEGGDGVRFDQLARYARAAAAAAGLSDARFESFRPASADADQLARLRDLLARNEASARDVLLVYFNQGVVTGDWDGPHVSLIGAHDAARDRVLVLEVDQEWYVPYWTPVPVLLAAMLKPAPPEHGPLAGQTGGILRISH